MKNIQPYLPFDLSDICHIWRQSARQAYPFLKTDFFLQEENRIVSEYLPNCETWVWKDQEGRRLGFISLIDNEIGGLFVLPKFQNQGIGEELVQFVSGNFPVLLVEVFAKNQSAIRFYQKMGFSLSHQKVHLETGEILVRMIKGEVESFPH